MPKQRHSPNDHHQEDDYMTVYPDPYDPSYNKKAKKKDFLKALDDEQRLHKYEEGEKQRHLTHKIRDKYRT